MQVYGGFGSAATTVTERDPSAYPTVLTYTVSGFVNGEGASVISGAMERVAGETPGTYAIEQGTLSAGSNYLITYIGADFKINAVAVPAAIPTLSEWGLMLLSSLLLAPMLLRRRRGT